MRLCSLDYKGRHSGEGCTHVAFPKVKQLIAAFGSLSDEGCATLPSSSALCSPAALLKSRDIMGSPPPPSPTSRRLAGSAAWIHTSVPETGCSPSTSPSTPTSAQRAGQGTHQSCITLDRIVAMNYFSTCRRYIPAANFPPGPDPHVLSFLRRCLLRRLPPPPPPPLPFSLPPSLPLSPTHSRIQCLVHCCTPAQRLFLLSPAPNESAFSLFALCTAPAAAPLPPTCTRWP